MSDTLWTNKTDKITELVGKRCEVVFEGDYERSCRYLFVVAIDGEMMKLSHGTGDSRPMWVSMRTIKRIMRAEPQDFPPRPLGPAPDAPI